MTITATQRQQITINCRHDSWQRFGPLLVALRVPAGTGPQVVADWLLRARPTVRAESQRVLLALERQRWSIEGAPPAALPGAPAGLSASARAGLLLNAGPTTWWLRFAVQPVLQVQAIERFTGRVGAGR